MEKNEELLLVLILIVVLLILSILIYYYIANKADDKGKDSFLQRSLDLKELQVQNLQAINDTLETESEKYATAIQDEIDPLLVTLQLNISKYRKDFQANRLRIEDLDYCQQFVDSIVTSLRVTSNNLATKKMLQYGLSSALKNYFVQQEDPMISFSSTLTESQFISKNQVINLYHIVIEVANGICKCDSPNTMSIRLEADDSDLIFYFTHEKSVFNLSIYPSKYSVIDRYTLDAIQARLSIVKAKIFFEKQDFGTTIVVKVPLC